jgi:GNAT superfamily N-acetyltransferase
MMENYEPAMLGDLVSAYNSAVRQVPHCYPVTGEEFEPVLAGIIGDQGPHGRLREEGLLLAGGGGSVEGFVHFALVDPDRDSDSPRGTIVFLWYRPGKREVGQSLLEGAQGHLEDRGIGAISAFEQDFRYPFYGFRHAYLSHHLGHVQALLGMNGYRRVKGEIFSDWPAFRPLRPDPVDDGIEIQVRFPKGGGSRPGVAVEALREGERIGFCGSRSCGDFSHAPEAQDWIFTDALNVSEEEQGRGLGKAILRRSLVEAHRLGYRNAAISNDWDNHRAFLFYTNFGYRVADWTYCLRRDLG